MWFAYRKSPLGTVLKETLRAILFFGTRSECREVFQDLHGKTSCRIQMVELNDSNLIDLVVLDPDFADVLKMRQVECIILAEWI